MKKSILYTFLSISMLFFSNLSFAQGDLILVGLLDGPFSGAPKFAELYVVNDIPDLSIYGLGSANNGQGTDSVEWAFPAEAAMAGSTIYVVNDAVEFTNFMGFNATYEDGGAACSFNGDDTFEVFENGVVIDVIGFIDVDGSDQTWEYLDGWVKRKNGTGPGGTTFVENEWDYSGINVFDGQTSNATSPTPYPTAAYSPEGGTGGDPTVDLILKGVIHANGDVKVTEFEVLKDIADLSIYGIGNSNNGGGSDGQEWTFPAVAATAGERLYVARDSAAFNAFFGFDANFFDPPGDVHTFNGDDGLEIFMNGTTVEIFGDTLLDGTGLAWEYSSGWAHRKDGTGPEAGGFVLGNWEFSALDNFVGVETNDAAPQPYPVFDDGTVDANNLVLVGLIYASADVKVSEYYALDDIADLSIYGVGCANNGGGSDGQEWTFPATSAAKGDRIFVARDSTAFANYFGFSANFYDPDGDAHSFNGDDPFELFGNGEVIDTYGDVELDGTGLDWEYVNTWVQRKCATGPDATFVLENWTIAPLETLAGTMANTDATEPYPVDTYSPEPCGETGGDTNLVITEIMYNSPGTDLEYLEFYNNTADPIDMTGYIIADGVEFTFPQFVLGAGEYVLVSDDAVGMQNFYGVSAFEWISGSLNNGGETVTLTDATGTVVDMVDYDDAAPWTVTPDGRGPSLVLCDVNADNNDGSNWQRAITSSGKFVDGREVFGNPGVASECVDVPIVAIQSAESIVGEADGTVTVLFYIDNPAETETTVDVNLVMGGSADENDFTFTPITITFPAMSVEDQMITIDILDDENQEPEESFAIEISNASNSAMISNSTMTFNIIDNDAEITNALKIIGLIHGPLSGVPKAVQFLAVKDIPNLSLFGLGCANNGGGTDGQEYTFPSVSILEGACFYVTNDAQGFRDFFGFDADFVDDGSANNFNGDDAYEIFENGEVIDVFGEIDADGTGTAWEYSLSWAHRIDAGTGPDGSTFVLENWEFGGVDTLANATTNATANNPYPDDMCGLVNIETVDLSSFIQLYPNPANATLQIASSIQLDEIEVFDIMGKSVLKVNEPTTYNQLEVSDLPNNIYFVRFISDKQMWTQKVMIHR